MSVSPRSISPWGDRVWRISATAQLVEGSKPYWIVSPTLPAKHSVVSAEIEVVAPVAEAVVDSILFLLASHFGDERLADHLVESHNLTVTSEGRELAPFYELSETSRRVVAERLANDIRLGFVLLDDLSLVGSEVIASLRGWGFDVDTFVSDSTSNV
jgi:hypothetical protein